MSSITDQSWKHITGKAKHRLPGKTGAILDENEWVLLGLEYKGRINEPDAPNWVLKIYPIDLLFHYVSGVYLEPY